MTDETPAHKNPVVVAFATTMLAAMRDESRSLQFAVLLTDDGFEVAHHSATLDATATADGKLASMSSSIQALSEAVTRELKISAPNEYIVLATDKGQVIQQRIPGHTLVLAALFSNDENLGLALSVLRRHADQAANFLTAQGVK